MLQAGARGQAEETGGQMLSETGLRKYSLCLLFNRVPVIDGMFVFPPKFVCSIYLQCNGICRWGLWEVIRLKG